MSKKLKGLKYMLIDELEQFADKGNISGGDLDPIYKLSGAAKRIACLCEMEDDEGYSERSSYTGYDDDMSYRRRGSYDRGRSGRRYSRYDGGMSGGSMREHLEAMLRDAKDPREREQIQRLMDDMQ